MSDTASPATPPPQAATPHRPLVWRILHGVEDAALVLALAAVVLIPLAEIVARTVFKAGVPGGNWLTQHLTLFISMFGGALAARESRLLTITQGFAKARAPWGAVFEIMRAGISAGIALLLAKGSWEFLLSERTTGVSSAIGLPVWAAQTPLLAGFLIIAVRLLLRCSPRWPVRLAAAALAAGLALIVLRIEPETNTLPHVLLGAIFVAVVLGAPIFVLLGGAALVLLWGGGVTLAAATVSQYSLATNGVIPSLPLFTLAGYFLAEGGTSQRMIRLLRALVGDMRAGPAIVTVGACAFFTSLTGASGVTILALGGLLVPFLVSARYPERTAIGLLTGSGSIGLLFAPCLPLIVYAIVADVEIKAMFLAGIVPGLLLAVTTAAWAAWIRPASAADAAGWTFNAREAFAATREAFWELLIPVVSLGAIFSGLANPVEAAAVTALYAFVIEAFVYRDLKPRSMVHAMKESGLLIGGVLLVLAVAQSFTNYLVDEQVPSRLIDLVQAHVSSRVVFIIGLTVVLLIVGCLMDVFSAIIVVVPLIVPLGALYGISPVHLGILFLANLGLGFLTPPVGMSLFLASYRFNRPMSEVLRASLPYFWLQFAIVLLISFWPDLSLALPRWLGFS
ncbi:MAG: TRAP transporter large permease subunit [Opitutaceae bacterium]|nr:TRAP transporter large permease subunit [Opitutaceae bacterium]